MAWHEARTVDLLLNRRSQKAHPLFIITIASGR